MDSATALDLRKGVDDLLNNLPASFGLAQLIHPPGATPNSNDEILVNVNLFVLLILRLGSQSPPLATSIPVILSDVVPQLLDFAAKITTKITIDLGSDLGQITDVSDLLDQLLALLGRILTPGGLTENTVQELADIQRTALALNIVSGRMSPQLNVCGCCINFSLFDTTKSLIASILRKCDVPLAQGTVFARQVLSRRCSMSSGNVRTLSPVLTTHVNTCELLKSLGLDAIMSINADIKGLTGFEQLTNSLLKLLGLGGYPITCGPNAPFRKTNSSSVNSTPASLYPSRCG